MNPTHSNRSTTKLERQLHNIDELMRRADKCANRGKSAEATAILARAGNLIGRINPRTLAKAGQETVLLALSLTQDGADILNRLNSQGNKHCKKRN